MQEIDYLVVGAGIAGLCIAEKLVQMEQNLIIMHLDLPGASSKVSSGLINPITGQRFVKSWNYEEVKISFLKFYQSLEQGLQVKLIQEFVLLEELKNPAEENQWLARSADPVYQEYLGDLQIHQALGYKKTNLNYGLLNKVYKIQVGQLFSAWDEAHERKGNIIREAFNFELLHQVQNHWIYKELKICKGIIFAEGHRIAQNPYFNWLPIVPLKGECLEFYAEILSNEFIYKSNYAIVPQGKQIFWCGSNFELTDQNLDITETERKNQVHFLDSKLDFSYQLINHNYGIRPAVRDRKPVVGPHPDQSGIFVLNGLGTKGFSLAPYCAEVLANFLVKGMAIPHNMGVERFKNRFYLNKA